MASNDEVLDTRVLASDEAQPELKIHPPVEDIRDLVMFRMARLTAIGERAAGRWLNKLYGMSVNEWRVMALVHAMEPVRSSDISTYLMMDTGQLSRVVRSLTNKKLIEARISTRDARSSELRLTPSGREQHDRMLTFVAARNEVTVSSLTHEECAEFLRILDKMTALNQELNDVGEG